jgi:hypothetical protein
VRPLVCIRKLLPVSVFDDETPVGLFGRPRRRESALKTDEATPPIELPDGRRAVEIAPGRIIWWQAGDRWKTSSGRVSSAAPRGLGRIALRTSEKHEPAPEAVTATANDPFARR